jgi:hypothetical protein
VAAAGLTERDAEPRVPRGDGEAARHRDVGVEEVPKGAVGSALVASAHLRTIAAMADDATRIRTAHGYLTLEQIGDLLPGTGELMQSVGNAWWKCAYAARGGNWALAAYFARRVGGLQRKLAIVRPKYASDVAGFEVEHLAAVLDACERKDRPAFDAAFASAVDRANELHAKWGKAYIRWTLPDEAPKDLELTAE